MAYRDFTFEELERKFGVRQDQKKLFEDEKITPVQPSDLLSRLLVRNAPIGKATEKAVSELIIMPVLSEVWANNQNKISLFSGEDLPGDRSQGLNGEVDFIIANLPRTAELRAPIISVTEAKLNKAIEKSTAQAGAQMTGAWFFNKKHGNETTHIYGAVTNGSSWLFMKLENDTLFIDTKEYGIINLPELLGVLQGVVNSFHE